MIGRIVCYRDSMAEMWNKRNFAIANLIRLGMSEDVIHGFIGEKIQGVLRYQDENGNKMYPSRDNVFEYLLYYIKEFDITSFETVLNKMIKQNYLEEREGLLYNQRPIPINMSL